MSALDFLAGRRLVVLTGAGVSTDKQHLYQLPNLYVDPRGFRRCRTCVREQNRRMRLLTAERVT